MQCRSCATEIADKAIVCYRCGASTTDPIRRPVPVSPRRSPVMSFAVVAVLIVVALYLGQASRTAADPERLQSIAGALAVAALLLLVVRLVRRR